MRRLSAGQLHVYSCGSVGTASHMPYDQFLSSDYAQLLPDLNGYVVDADTGLAPHNMAHRQLLTDFDLEPYDLPVQQVQGCTVLTDGRE